MHSRSSSRTSSLSSSCAAPRMPPKGFLISCAKLRRSSLLAARPASAIASRSARSASSRSTTSRSAVVPDGAFTGLGESDENEARTRTDGRSPRRNSTAGSMKDAASTAPGAAARRRNQPAASGRNSATSTPDNALRVRPISVSAAALADVMRPSSSSRNTASASASKRSKLVPTASVRLSFSVNCKKLLSKQAGGALKLISSYL